MTRTLPRTTVGDNGLYAGIDLGRDKNVVVVYDGDGQRVMRMQFKHSRAAYERLAARLEQLRQQRKATGVLIGMEPTGYFWKWLAHYLEQRQLPYRLVNAYTVKQFRQGMQLDRAKDDQRDAAMIAELLRIGRFTQTQRLCGDAAEMRQYSWQHAQIRDQMRRVRMRLHQQVDQLFPEVWQVFSRTHGLTASAMLKRHAAAVVVREMTCEQFIAAVRADFTGSHLQVSKLRAVHQLAADSVGLPESEALQWGVAHYLDELARLQAGCDAVGERLVTGLLRLPTAPYLLSLGLGAATTAHIVAELGDFDRFRNAGQLVKMAGVQPSPNSSGRRQGKSRMSRQGRSAIRASLFLAVLRLVQFDPAYAAQFQRLQQRPHKPMCKMQAIIALMCKSLHILWALHRKQQFYDPSIWGSSTD